MSFAGSFQISCWVRFERRPSGGVAAWNAATWHARSLESCRQQTGPDRDIWSFIGWSMSVGAVCRCSQLTGFWCESCFDISLATQSQCARKTSDQQLTVPEIGTFRFVNSTLSSTHAALDVQLFSHRFRFQGHSPVWSLPSP